MQDTMDMIDDDDIEEEAEEEVNQILYQITDGRRGKQTQCAGNVAKSC